MSLARFRMLTGTVAAALLTASAAWSQTGASRFALAQVADASGKTLVDIDIDDFVVQEAGTARDVLDVRVADYPVAIVLDNGRSAVEDFDALKTSVARFVTRLGPRPIALVTTAGTPRIVAAFEDDREVVTSTLARLAADPSADGQPVRAAAAAAEAIRATGALFSTTVLTTASAVEVTGSAADDLLAPIIDSRTVVHVVANAARAGANGQLLRSIAEQTHGNYTAIYASPSYQPALDRLAARLTTELLIEYLVPVGSKAADVKIGVRLPGARVRGLGVAPR